VIRQIRSELLKLRTTRTTLGLVLGMLALVAFSVVIQLVASRFQDAGIPRIEESDTQRTIFTTASTAGLFAILVGVMSVTGEFRHGTIRPTLLFAPARAVLVAAKGVACALAGVLLAVLSVALTFAIAWTWLRIDDVERLLGNHDLAAIAAGTVAATLLWAAIGVGVGAVVRNQVAAILAVILWTLIPEPLLMALVPGVGRFTPGVAADAVSGAARQDMLSPLAGMLVLGLWALALVVAGGVVTARRDVP
jgi:ABC-2 type transport system permease protein